MSDCRVAGLLEVFSPQLRGFTKDHETVLDRLAAMIPKTFSEETQPENSQPEKTLLETPVRPEAWPRPPASDLGSIKSGSPELVSIQETREGLGEQKPEVVAQVSERVFAAGPQSRRLRTSSRSAPRACVHGSV